MSLLRVPLDFVCPVGSGHFALGNVLGVPRMEGFALTSGLVGFHALLTETNGFGLVSDLGDDDVAL